MNEPSADPFRVISLAAHYSSIDQPQKGLDALVDGPEQLLDLPAYWSLRSSLLYQLGRDQEALATAQKGLSLFPDFTPLKMVCAGIYGTLNNLAKAEMMILAALQDDPEHVNALKVYAGLLIKGGQVEKAARVVERALEYDPEDMDLKRMEAVKAYYDGDRKLAKQLAEESLQDDPENAAGRQFLGGIYLEEGEYSSGKRLLASAAILSGGERSTVINAREAKIMSHWLLIPLRPIQRFGPGPVWIAAIVTILALRAFAPSNITLIATIAYVIWVIYSWVIPPLLRRWFDYQYGKLNE